MKLLNLYRVFKKVNKYIKWKTLKAADCPNLQTFPTYRSTPTSKVISLVYNF